jgi:hypothetical protein
LSKAEVPKLCSADPKGSATSSQGMRGYISVLASLKFDGLLEIIVELLLQLAVRFISYGR